LQTPRLALMPRQYFVSDDENAKLPHSIDVKIELILAQIRAAEDTSEFYLRRNFSVFL